MGEFVIVSETHRTQLQNLNECFTKLHVMLLRAAEVPGETSLETRARVRQLQGKARDERIRDKRERSSTKNQRRAGNQHDD